MHCPNCGAKLDRRALHCAYCGHENEHAAKERQRREVAGFYARLADRLHLPERTAEKLTRWLLLGAAALAGLFLAALLAAFLIGTLGPRAGYARQQRQLAALEELYQAADYAALGEALEDMRDARGASYEKYETVAGLYGRLARARESCAETAEFLRGYPEGADLLAYELDALFGLLNECGELAQAGYVYGEEKAVEIILKEAETILRETLLLTEEEIEEGKALARQETPDYAALYTASAQRIAEVGA